MRWLIILIERSYFSLIEGATFSAGAGGSAGFAPSACAFGLGRAGSGAGMVGRVLPGLDSAGLSTVGEACRAGVACTSPLWGSRASSSVSDRTEIASPAMMSIGASCKSFTGVSFVLFPGNILLSPRYVREINGWRGAWFQSESFQSASSPASPTSSENASNVPLAFQASAAMAGVPFRRTRSSPPSSIRTSRMVPSA